MLCLLKLGLGLPSVILDPSVAARMRPDAPMTHRHDPNHLYGWLIWARPSGNTIPKLVYIAEKDAENVLDVVG